MAGYASSSTGNKKTYDQQIPKRQREKRKSNFNNYENLNLNSRVNFIPSGNSNDELSKTDKDNDEFNRSCQLQIPPPPPPLFTNNKFQFQQTAPQLKGIGGKLLLQMGYEPGKGLGKNLQGIQEPIKAKPRLGRGAIGAYGPEQINTLPIETINSSNRYNQSQFVIDEKINADNDNVLIKNLVQQTDDNMNNNEENNGDAIVKELTNIVMALSDETNKITSTTTTQTIDKSISENISETNLQKYNLSEHINNINDSLKLSIISYEFPKIKLTDDQFEEIEYKIFNLLFNSDDQIFKEPIQFHKCVLMNGTIQFVCANESTKKWLYHILENNFLINIKLNIVETHTLEKYERIHLWLCGPKLTADIILKTLQKQNHNLKTDKWRVHSLNYFRHFNSTELVVGIDCISLSELKKINLKPFYRFGRCDAHLKGFMTENSPYDLIFLMHQISSMNTLTKNSSTIEINENLESDIIEPSWNNFMIKLRSKLLVNFGYDPKNDSKLLFKSNITNIPPIYNSRNQNSKRFTHNKKPKIKISSVSDSLKLAIIDKGDPEGKIRNVNHQEILRETLNNALFELLDQPEPKFIPKFHWSGFKDDIFKIICQDEQSKICLYQLVESVGNIWFEADLCLLGLEDILKLRNPTLTQCIPLRNGNNSNTLFNRMLKELSRQFNANWRESEKKERKILEKFNRKSNRRNSTPETDFIEKMATHADALKVAIIDNSDVEGKIINIEHQNLLEEALNNAIIKITDTPNIVPRYNWSGFINSIFKVICYDEQSKICLEEIVKNIRNLWEGAELVVVGWDELLNIQQISTSKYNSLKSEVTLKEYDDDNWKIDEQLQFKELKEIRNKPSYINPKEQRKPKSLQSVIHPPGFLINIRKISNEKFKHIEFKALKESLELLIYETINSQEFYPQFENIKVNGEILCVHCANFATQEWFSNNIIPKFSSHPPWQDAELLFDIINNNPENKLEKRIQAKIWFPGIKLKSDDYLRMLQAQNNSVDTRLWLIDNRKDATDGVHLYITIDKLSTLILNSIDKRPYFGSGRAEIKILNMNSPI